MNEFINTLIAYKMNKYHFVISSILNFIENYINGNTEYLKEGMKYGLWKDVSNAEEERVLNKDVKKLTNISLGELNESNFMPSLFEVASFIINENEKRMKYKELSMNSIQLQFREILGNQKKDEILEIWLRFCLRLSHFSRTYETSFSYIG